MKGYIFEKKGVFSEDFLSPTEIKKYEKEYGKLIGIESNGIIIQTVRGEKDDFNKPGNSGKI